MAMLVDRTTETISHFIGLFALKVEQERLRDSYEEFTAGRRKADLVPVEPMAPEVDHHHQLRTSNAGPKEPAIPETRETVDLEVPRWPGPEAPEEGPPAPLLELSGEIAAIAGPGLIVLDPPEPPMPPLPEAGVPGSMLTVTVQVARLHDNDTIGAGDFRDVSLHAADLAAWAEVAQTLHAPAGPGRGEIPTLEDALALHAAMQDFVPVVPEGAEVFTVLGPAVPRIIVNGEEVEEAPSWKDLLPAYHQDTEEAAGLEDWELPEFYRPNPDGPDGHEIVAGGNLLVNEAQIALSYIDAPLIAVGGTWIDLDIVSQVALVSNHDEGLSIGEEGASAVYQIVEIEETAKEAAWTIPGSNGAEAPPSRISVEIVEGDLLVSNTIEQVIELLDNDAFAMSITAANSAFILGANIVVNATSLVTAGFGYDLILIGGDFISIDTIHQTLVLLDDDRVETGPQAPAVASFDSGSALATDGVAEASDGISGGIGTEREDVVEPEDEDVATDPAPDNLLVNKALLKTVGVDTAAEMTDGLADILASPSDDLETLREKLLNDPALAGLEQARVLKINGDLILSNTVKQTILASDRDDILVDNAPPGLDVVAGQNAMLNAASISLWGVDSKVMTANEVYSDLLIHQARLVDEPDMDGTADPGLVNEAVAFLMDDIGADVAGKTADVAGKADLAPSDAYDLMQSTLT
jgi:hypothetical protein